MAVVQSRLRSLPSSAGTVAAVLAALTLVGAPCLWSQSPPPTAVAEPAPEPTRAPAAAETGGQSQGEGLTALVAKTWADRRAFLESGDEGAAHAKILAIVQARDRAGVAGLPTLNHALLAEAYAAARAGKTDLAEARFSEAIDVDPASYEARVGLARAHGSLYSVGGIKELLAALTGLLSGVWGASTLLASALLVLALAAVLSAVLAVLALALRHQPLWRHEIFESWKRRLGSDLAGVLGWVALLLPLMLGFDLAWAAIYWAVTLGLFLSVQERVIAAVALVFLGLAPALVGTAERLSRAVADPFVCAAASFREGLPDRDAVAALTRQLGASEDPDGRLLLGLVAERQGQPREALGHYHKVMDEPAFKARVLTNMGNIHYRLDEKDQALDFWNKAVEADPRFAPVLYNLSLYYLDQFNFQKRTEYFNKAKDLDPKLLEHQDPDVQHLLDGQITDGEIWRRLLAAGPSKGEAMDYAAALGRDIAATPVAIAAWVGLALLLFMRLSGGVGRAHACTKCGRPYCAQCKVGKESDPYCVQCVHLFVKKDGVSPQMRSEKMSDVKRYQTRDRWIRLVLALVPGASQLYGDRPVSGFLLLGVWSTAVALAVLGGGVVANPGVLGVPPTNLAMAVGGTVAGLIWVLNLARVASER